MFTLERSEENPILVPNSVNLWEADLAYNGCPVAEGNKIHFLYRALSAPQNIQGTWMQISSIGYALSKDGVHFSDRRQLIKPEEEWERYGCEDPRVTKLGDKYYIFYTALSSYPFRAEGIKVAVAITKDFKKIEAKYLVTPFNAKAMTLFPEKINGKIAAILSVNTDNPPATMGIIYFNREEQIWSREYWEKWYEALDYHSINLARSYLDHTEVGAPPIKTDNGWLFFYSYIQNYFSPPTTFTVEAALLDLVNPTKILARTEEPLLVPQEEYEKYGKVPNIVFPTGALIKKDKIFLYYGAADTTCALATGKLSALIKEMMRTRYNLIKLERFVENPIIEPKKGHSWEAKATFNPAAILLEDKVHIIYRAVSDDNTSVFGYASSKNGFTIDERLPDPIYVPREDFEMKSIPGGNSGCEDPRITQIGDVLYMCYTAYSGLGPPRVALTSIAIKDFLDKKWDWSKPILISPPDMDDKDSAIFPKKIKGRYAILHRLGESIWLDYADNLKFEAPSTDAQGKPKFLKGEIIMNPRSGTRDSKRIGIAGPPIETKKGWLLLYHGISKKPNHHYHVRAALLDLENPARVIVRSKETILETEMSYEKYGVVPNVVFPCGAVVIDGRLFVYYGGADKVIGVATMMLDELIEKLLAESKEKLA